MDALKRSMRWDEERFGREYDLGVFNIVAVSDFNMGAMENKGLNIFNDGLILASPETATDATFAAIERVIAHEYFHNWTGNRITCRDWFQLCLKEGLTVFRDQEFCADQRSATVERIRDVRSLEGGAVPRGRRPAGASRAARPLYRDQQLLHVDRLQQGRRAGAHDPDAAGARGLPQGHGRLFRAPRRPGGHRGGLRRLFRGRDGQRPAAVHDLVLPGRHARARLPAQVRCARQDRRPHHCPGAAADARRAQEEAAAHPGAAGPLGRQRPGPRPHAGLRPAARRRPRRGQEAHGDLPLPRRAVTAGALAAARLLGARQPDDRPCRCGPAVPDGQRQRSLQSLAGGAGLCNARPGRRGEGHSRRQAASQALGVRGCARRHARR